MLILNIFFLICFWVKSSEGLSDFGNILQGLFRRESFSKNYIIKDVTKYGYPIEVHNVTTADGYQLKLHRIPYSPKVQCKIKLPPVYLFHGLLGNADIWLLNGPEDSLPFMLSNAGYDVWLGNARGTTHSRSHQTLNPNSQKFWQFTWHEIGIYDNPANLNYILTKTNSKQLHYIGHSQGTTSFFVMTSMIPEYNSVIKSMHALSPVAFMKHEISPFFTLPAKYFDLIMQISKTYGLTEFLPNTQLIKLLQILFCNNPNPDRNLCYKVLAAGGGQSLRQYDMGKIYKSFDVTPAGASIYQLLHYSQGVRTGKFQTFDYRNRKENIRRYGYPTPIDYPLKRITAPLYFHVSGNDLIAPLQDVNLLINGLPKKPTYIEIADKKFNHFDYLTGKNVRKLVYDRILSDIQNTDQIICNPTNRSLKV